jgi:biofilm PGA synthesis protein PgaD
MTTFPGDNTIDVGDKLNEKIKRRDRILTVVLWALYAYLWIPLISLVAWYVGVDFAYRLVERAGGPASLGHLLVWFGFFTILITIAVTAWSTLQFWRFRGRDRRLESAVVSTEAEIGYWGIDRDQFEAIRNGQCQLVALDAQGRLLSVTELSDR